MVPQKPWVCEVDHGSVSGEPALVIDHLGFVLKVVNCQFLVLWVSFSKVVIGNFFPVHLLVLHLQTEDAPFEPCKFQDEDQKTLFEVSVSPVL